MSTSITSMADELLALQSAVDPLNATMLGVPGYDHLLPNYDHGVEQDLRARAVRIATQAGWPSRERSGAAGAGDGSVLAADDAVTAAVVAQQARALADRIDAATVDFSVTDNNYVGPAATLLTLMPVVSLADRERAEAYLHRLGAIPAYLRSAADRHRDGIRTGRRPVRRLVRAAVAHLDRYLAEPGADPLRRPAGEGADAGFIAAREALLSAEVRPAFAAYREVLAGELDPLARADDQAGLCWLPDGTASYAALSRVHTTVDRTPEQLHQAGLDVIARLRDEYAEVGAAVFGISQPEEIFARLAGDASMRWTSAPDLLAAARDAVARAEADLPKWFSLLPRHQCQVQEVPAAEAPGAPFAYYFPPSLDGLRPGVYHANTFGIEQRDRYIGDVTAFHEAVPGHHLQLSVALDLTHLPLLRRLADINAFIEGWALYSERLADEMGLYPDQLSRLGMLAMDSMRAGRLVVDTGLHALGWSRQQAVDYLSQHTPLSRLAIEGEVDRYLAYPGQALAYLVGRLEIERIRQAARLRLGGRFDIRAFHDLVLGGGAVPLSVLEEVVTSWDGRSPAKDPHASTCARRSVVSL